MISVYLLDNGDVAYRCSVCDHTDTVATEESKSPFWHEANGMAILSMIGHYQDSHDSRSIAKEAQS